MKYCPKCYYQLELENDLKSEDGLQYCPKCNACINPEISAGNPKIYIIVYLIFVALSLIFPFALYLFSNLINLKDTLLDISVEFFLSGISVLSSLIFLFPIAALVTITTGFIKCPKSRAIKVLFWVTIGLIILSIIAIIILVISCVYTINTQCIPMCDDAMDTCRDCPG